MASLLLVDDNPEFCASSIALMRLAGLEIVACVGTGAAPTEGARSLRPEVMPLDVQLPDVDGFEVARRPATLGPRPAVILISIRDSSTYGTAVLAYSTKVGDVGIDPATGAVIPCLNPNPQERPGSDPAAYGSLPLTWHF